MHKDHKRDFNFLNFHTEYSVSGNNRISHDVRSCFYELVRRHKFEYSLKINELCSNKYQVYVYFVNNTPELGCEENNCCLLSKDELSEWINDMKRFAEFEYTIGDDKYTKQDESVVVNITFKDRPFVEHFLVLELLKHSYEFPFNFSVYQAVKMRNIINSEELLVNLHNMIFCCNKDFVCHACSDHILCSYEYVYKISDFGCYNCTAFPVIYMPSAEDITKRCSLSNALFKIFNPAYLDADHMQFEEDARNNMRYFIDGSNETTKEPNEEIRKQKISLYEYSQKFEYFDNALNDCKTKLFESYFDVELSKKRLDAYIKTYEAIKYYGRGKQ